MPISLGDITFGIGPDTTRLRTSIGDITNFGRAVEAAARQTGAGAAQAEAALRRQEAAAISALQRVQRFQDQVARSNAPIPVMQGLNQLSTRGLEQITARMTSGRLSAIQYQREMERFNATMMNSTRIFGGWAAATKQAEASNMVASLQKLSGAAVLVAGPLSGIATRISVISNLAEHFSLSWAAMIAGVAAGTYVFYKLGTAAVDTARKLQSIEQTLAAVSGSNVIASTTMNYLAGFADRAGVKFDVLAKQYGQIEAAAKGTILEGERTRDIFEAVTMAGSKLGLSGDEVKGTLTAIQQMMSKGKISAEELRQQLGDRLPGAVQIMAKALGISTQALDKQMRAGELGISTLIKFANELKKRYDINENTKIDTIVAAEARLYNARMKFIDQLDKIIGFSDAYKNTLNALTGAINGADGKARDLVITVVSVGAALTAAFIASRAVPAIFAIGQAVYSLTAAIVTLNVASMAGGFTTIIRLLVAASVGIAAYYGASKLMDKALDDTKKSMLTTLPAVDAYIEAQKTLASSVRAPTIEYIKQTEAALKFQEGLKTTALESYTKAQERMNEAFANGATRADVDKIGESMGIKKISEDSFNAIQQVMRLKGTLKELQDILKRQTEAESKDRNDPIKEMTNRQNLAIKNAKDTVSELTKTYENLYKAPAAKEWATTQNEISKAVENFRDNLARSELPAAKITELTNKYAAALRKVKEGELNLKNHVSFFQGLEGVFSRGLDTAMNNWIETIMEGKDALLALKDTGKAVAADLLKTFMTLAALNPLKNALFGTNAPTLGGSGGVGGLLGSAFSGMFGGGSAFGTQMAPTSAFPIPFAMGGIMTSSGPKPLRSYASGGIANSAQYAEFGEGSRPEAFVPLPDGRSIPVTMSGGGGGTMEVHIYEAPGTKASATKRKNANGGEELHVWIKSIAKDAVLEDMMGNGAIATGMEKKYGLDRTKGIA